METCIFSDEKKDFKPVRVHIVAETEEDLQYLYHLTNVELDSLEGIAEDYAKDDVRFDFDSYSDRKMDDLFDQIDSIMQERGITP